MGTVEESELYSDPSFIFLQLYGCCVLADPQDRPLLLNNNNVCVLPTYTVRLKGNVGACLGPSGSISTPQKVQTTSLDVYCLISQCSVPACVTLLPLLPR